MFLWKCNVRRLWICTVIVKVTFWVVLQTFYFVCSGRALKKVITIAGFVGSFRLTHPPVGVIYLRGESEWSKVFYNLHISIYKKEIYKRNNESCYPYFERNGEIGKRERKSNCWCRKKLCLAWESLAWLGALTKQVFHRTRHDKHCKMCTLIVKAWFVSQDWQEESCSKGFFKINTIHPQERDALILFFVQFSS